MRALSKILPLLIAALLAPVALTGCCSRTSVEWIPDGTAQTLADAERTARNADVSFASGVDVEDAPDVRAETLAWLRQRGPDGDRAASLLTKGFPDRTASVPVRVEIASVEGTRSLIVVEAFGGPSGTLTYRRLWVFEMESGRLVRSAAFR